MPEPTDMILPMLRELREEILTSRGESRTQFETLERRLQSLEAVQVSFKQALSADSLLSKLVTGEFEEPIEALERRVRELEDH
jgi:polyhydroxyalkanoate synthesis regulator phasin